MSLNKFITLFEEEFDDLPEGTASPDKSFAEIIQMNSLNVLMLLGFIKVEYDIDVTVEDVKQDITIREFYERYIQPVELRNG